MWKKWKFWDKYYKKSMLRAFAGRELKMIKSKGVPLNITNLLMAEKFSEIN